MSGQPESGADAERLPPEVSRRLFLGGAAIAAVGIVLAAIAGFADAERFAFSYLVGYYFTVTAAVGALIWIIIQHLAKAGWSVAARRMMEWIAGFLPLAIVLFIPVVVLAPHIYHHWWGGPETVKTVVEEGVKHTVKHLDESIEKKHAFLNPGAFYGLSFLFLVVWAGASWFFRSRSLQQDTSGDPRLTITLQTYAPPFIFAVGYSLAFSGLLWVMSIEPHWFSTMWGVYVFAGSMTSSMATVALLTVYLQGNGYLRRVSTVEHLHDIGKLLFAFVVFFAYIGFCQFFLIWYGNIPEETVFFKARVVEGWKAVSYSLPILHFAVPFLWLLPRTVKRNRSLLSVGAIIMIVMHYVDVYWMVMPNLDEEGAHFTWIDLGGLLAPLGVMLAWLGYCATRYPIYPLRDPRIPETMRNDNGQG